MKFVVFKLQNASGISFVHTGKDFIYVGYHCIYFILVLWYDIHLNGCEYDLYNHDFLL